MCFHEKRHACVFGDDIVEKARLEISRRSIQTNEPVVNSYLKPLRAFLENVRTKTTHPWAEFWYLYKAKRGFSLSLQSVNLDVTLMIVVWKGFGQNLDKTFKTVTKASTNLDDETPNLKTPWDCSRPSRNILASCGFSPTVFSENVVGVLTGIFEDLLKRQPLE